MDIHAEVHADVDTHVCVHIYALVALNVHLQRLKIEGCEVGVGEREGEEGENGEREGGREVKVGGGGKGEGEGGEVEGEGGGKGRVEEEGEIMDLDELLRRERQKEEKRKIIAPEAQVSIVHKWQFVMLTEYPILLLLRFSQ